MRLCLFGGFKTAMIVFLVFRDFDMPLVHWYRNLYFLKRETFMIRWSPECLRLFFLSHSIICEAANPLEKLEKTSNIFIALKHFFSKLQDKDKQQT